MATLFTRIIERKIPAEIIAEDEKHIAFLDIRPLAKGHTLVVPKQEVDYFFAMEEAAMHGLMDFAGKVAKALERAVSCERIGMLVLGLEVLHVHIHLVPLQGVGQVDLGLPKEEVSKEEMKKIAEKIRAYSIVP